MQDEISKLRKRVAELEDRLTAIESSTSWRITRPLRIVVEALKGKRRRAPVRSLVQSPAPMPATTEDRTAPAPDNSVANARSVEDKLWGGFSRYALRELESIASTGRGRNAANAGWALACWHTADNEFEKAVDALAAAADTEDSGAESIARALVRSYCLVRLGRAAEARAVLEFHLSQMPDDPSLCLAMANTFSPAGGESDDDQRLHWLNVLYAKAGLARLAKRDASRDLAIDNLAVSDPVQDLPGREARVSVILPLYGAEETLRFTLDSILSQSWRNLELVIVEDRSPDGSFAIAKEYAARDSRIKLLRQDRNRGSYSARNRGLEIATGDFMTVHDAGDWSHPQKIEVQARHLIANPGFIANHSRWARAYQDMLFGGKFRRKDKLIDWNPSSFFFRRELLDKIGAWDAVRISADAEFVRRTKKCFSDKKVGSALDVAPLAFGFDTDTSLTKTGATHGRTIYHGIRREYHEAANHWHATAPEAQLRLSAGGERRFPAPGPILPDREAALAVDRLVIADFNGSPYGTELAKQLASNGKRGAAPGILNWPRYSSDATRPLDPSLRELAARGLLRVAVPGVAISAKRITVVDPRIFEHLIDLAPAFDAETLDVLVVPAANVIGAQQTEPSTAIAHIRETFGMNGRWFALDEAARRESLADGRFPPLEKGDWTSG